MLEAGEDELICDMAETYHVYDWRGLPLKTAAALAAGLPAEARIRRKLAGRDYTTQQLLLAQIVDSLRWLQWAKTKDGAAGRNRPKSIVEAMTRQKEEPSATARGFKTAAEFEAAYRKFIGEDP